MILINTSAEWRYFPTCFNIFNVLRQSWHHYNYLVSVGFRESVTSLLWGPTAKQVRKMCADVCGGFFRVLACPLAVKSNNYFVLYSSDKKSSISMLRCLQNFETTEQMKNKHCWGFVRESTGHRWISITKKPVMWNFDIFVVASLSKLLNKQSFCPWL